VYQVYRSGDLRGMKIAYPTGVGVVIWRPFGPDIEHTGPCFDLPVEDIDSIIELGLLLKEATPDDFVDVELPDEEAAAEIEDTTT
jgi:hypothetical protein